MLGQGEDGIRKLIAEAERLNPALNSINADKIEAANDAWGKMQTSITSLADTMAIKLAPSVEKFAAMSQLAFEDVGSSFDLMINHMLSAFAKFQDTVTFQGFFKNPSLPTDQALQAPNRGDKLQQKFADQRKRIFEDMKRRHKERQKLSQDDMKRQFKKFGRPILPDPEAPDGPAPGLPNSAIFGGGKFRGSRFKRAFITDREDEKSGRARLGGGAAKGSREALERILRAQQRQKDPAQKTQQNQLTELKGIRKLLTDQGKQPGLTVGMGLAGG